MTAPAMAGHPEKSVRRLLALPLLVILPLLGFEILSISELRHTRELEIQEESSRILDLIEAEQQHLVENIHNILVTLTEMGIGRMDGAACNATIRRLKEQYPSYLAVSISNGDNLIWCSTTPSAVGISVADRPYREEALRGTGIVAGQAIAARTTGRPVIPFALAYQDARGERAGVVTVLLDIGWLEQYLAQKSLPDHATVLIADGGGRILAAVPATPMAPGQRLPDELRPLLKADDGGVVEQRGGDGTLRVIAYSPPTVKLRGLYFQVSLDKDAAMRSVDIAALRSLLIFCGLSLLAGIGAAWGLRWFLRIREQAQRSALKTASVLASTVDGVVELDRDWRFTYLNDKARALSPGGRDLLGLSLRDGFPELAAGPLWERMQRAMADRGTVDVEFQGTRSGRWFWMRAFPSENGLTLYLLDITRRRKAEEDLRRSNDHLSMALESAQAGTFDWDLRTHGGYWSEASYRIFGLDPDTDPATTDRWRSILHPDDRHAATPVEWTTVPDQPSVTLEYRVLHPGGRVRWVLSIGRVRADEDGTPVQFSGINIDVTQRKAMEEALQRTENRLNIALSAANAALWDIDLLSGTVNWSENNYRLFGLDPATVTPNRDTFLEQVHPADREAVLAHLHRVLDDGEPDQGIEYRVLHPQDGTRWILSVGRVERDRSGRPVHFSALNIDLTARKAMEESLRDAKEKADEANVSKSRFLAAASHDLRQPLQSALLFAGALHPHVDAARGRGPLTSLERALDTLKNLLDSLLDVSRLDAGVIAPRIVDLPLGPVLEEIAAAYAPIAASKGLAFEVSTACAALTVRSDALLLGRMLRNLVENALRYTDQGHVRIQCDTVRDSVCIKVQDSGIGISAEHQTKVFEEFHQVGNPERDRSQGLGLGLAIVQRLSRLLNHPVLVRSEPGKGSVFSIEVPRAAVEPAAPAGAEAARIAAGTVAADTAADEGHGRLAVVIDDDVIVLTGLRTIFEEWSYDVVMAGSTDQALERLESIRRAPDIIVADYRLRDRKVGTEAIVRIRERAGRPIPGIILTGEIGTECEREAAALGLAVVHKPITPRQLRGIVQRLIGE
ncbi:PAS domain S-box-containing protein [Azospirillum lipoferum]|nr:PAS domain S-box-containing protein [Azospirillum lipoferum]